MFNFKGPDRRKEEERFRNERRLPPGQALTLKFPVLHYGPVPPFNPATWDFRAWGEVEEEKLWTWEQFNRLPHALHVRAEPVIVVHDGSRRTEQVPQHMPAQEGRDADTAERSARKGWNLH